MSSKKKTEKDVNKNTKLRGYEDFEGVDITRTPYAKYEMPIKAGVVLDVEDRKGDRRIVVVEAVKLVSIEDLYKDNRDGDIPLRPDTMINAGNLSLASLLGIPHTWMIKVRPATKDDTKKIKKGGENDNS